MAALRYMTDTVNCTVGERFLHSMADQGTRVGVIGLGKMGKPITRNLLKAGYKVTIHNRSRPAIDELVAEGAIDGGSVASVAESTDVVFTSLPDPAAVRNVYLEPGGLVESARDGQIFIDTSTIDPGLSRQLAEEFAKAGAGFLDAPVSGGVAGAEAGTLTVMVGGDAEAFAKAEPVLSAIGQKLHHVGPSGAGTIVKLANQLLVGINMAAAAEALVLGVKAGADPEKMLEVLSTSFGSSRMLERGVPLIVERNFGGGTPVDLLRKDLGLIQDLASELGVPLTTGAEARRVFDRAHDASFGANDMTAIIRPLEDAAGIEVKRVSNQA
jgi:3-hydroxyisobutyrate dehydrogenase